MRFVTRKGKHNGKRAMRGFTLVEVLICLALLSILFGTIYRSFSSVNRYYTKENVKAGVQQKARIGIDLMARDIRLAGLDPLATSRFSRSASASMFSLLRS